MAPGRPPARAARRRHPRLEASDAVRESLIASMDSDELLAALETLEADEPADVAADLPAEVIVFLSLATPFLV
jgi:magnesium transporter